MTIVKMDASHVSQVAQLEKFCFSDPWSEKSVASELNNKLALWLVAMDGDRVVGYVGSQTVLDETDMMNIAVHPDFRRQGIAEQLVNALAEKLKGQGSRSLALEVRESNHPAQILYQKLGFHQIGKRPNYYRNPKEAAIILRKEWEI